MIRLTTFITTAFWVTSAQAYGHVSQLELDSQFYSAYDPYLYPYMTNPPELIAWTIPGDEPVTNYTIAAIACNENAKAGALSGTVAAGSTIDIYWKTWDKSYKGPISTYLAACPDSDCTTVTDPTTLSFFKIGEGGYNTATDTWATDSLVANNLTRSIVVPEKLKPGAYLLRHEAIGLVIPDSPKFFPMCANIKVTGSGTALPSADYLVKFPGVYTDDDTSIMVDIYSDDLSTYTPPGPDQWSG